MRIDIVIPAESGWYRVSFDGEFIYERMIAWHISLGGTTGEEFFPNIITADSFVRGGYDVILKDPDGTFIFQGDRMIHTEIDALKYATEMRDAEIAADRIIRSGK